MAFASKVLLLWWGNLKTLAIDVIDILSSSLGYRNAHNKASVIIVKTENDSEGGKEVDDPPIISS